MKFVEHVVVALVLRYAEAEAEEGIVRVEVASSLNIIGDATDDSRIPLNQTKVRPTLISSAPHPCEVAHTPHGVLHAHDSALYPQIGCSLD